MAAASAVASVGWPASGISRSWKARLSGTSASRSCRGPGVPTSTMRSASSSSAAMSAAVALGTANPVSWGSREARRSKTPSSSATVQVATRAPRLATISTRPSAASRVSASRTGVRLTPSRSASSTSPSREPGASSPARIRSRSSWSTRSADVRDRVTRHTPWQIVCKPRAVPFPGATVRRKFRGTAYKRGRDVADMLSDRGTPRAHLRELVNRSAPLVAPGAYDALSARLIEQAGFEAVYMTGFGTTASLIGRPDVGLLSGAEMVDNARRIVAAVDVPVIADADTGYGNAINVVRTVQLYEQAGVAGLQLEDQVAPKKCGHMSGKAVIETAEMVGKLQAAVAARRDPDLVVIARTDAVAVSGVADAVERAQAYVEAGADVLFVEAPTSAEDIATIAGELRGLAPLVFNWAEGGRTPALPLARIAELGFSLVIYPIGTLLAATAGIRTLLASLRADGVPSLTGLPAFDEFTGFVGLSEVQQLEQRFRG